MWLILNCKSYKRVVRCLHRLLHTKIQLGANPIIKIVLSKPTKNVNSQSEFQIRFQFHFYRYENCKIRLEKVHRAEIDQFTNKEKIQIKTDRRWKRRLQETVGECSVMTRARKIVTKVHNYSYQIVMSPVIVNSYKNGHNSYQIVKKNTINCIIENYKSQNTLV